ncbi:hypothetical protein JXA40_11825 [bacterium]|nr:hypothetical protein [candidate division CSSED10-310 bacterium]
MISADPDPARPSRPIFSTLDPILSTELFLWKGPRWISHPQALGSTDTLITRLDTANLPACGSTDTITVDLTALNLVSTTPITITYFGGMTSENREVRVCLFSTLAQPPGSMSVNRESDEGGTFSVLLPIIPKFVLGFAVIRQR